MPKFNKLTLNKDKKYKSYPEYQLAKSQRDKLIYETVTKKKNKRQQKEKKRLNIRAGGNLIFALLLFPLLSFSQCTTHEDCANNNTCTIPYCNNGTCVYGPCQVIEIDCKRYNGQCRMRRCQWSTLCCCITSVMTDAERKRYIQKEYDRLNQPFVRKERRLANKK